MPKFRFGKLVRDKIVAQQIASGAKVTHRTLLSDEHKQELVKKIIEEAHEIARATEGDAVIEIADVQQVLDDLRAAFGLTSKDIAKAQADKNKANGTFAGGIFVEHVEVDANNRWVAYYRKHADRYPEIE